jgi:hypothetical protein
MQEKLRLKVICLTPKGKAEKCAKEWRKQFPTFKKPIEQKVVNDSKFYWIYEFEKEKEMYRFNKKIAMVQTTIKRFYYIIMGTSTRANRLKKKMSWGLDKARRWALKRINKQLGKGKEIDDFKDLFNMEDEAEMRKFLEKDIIQAKII